MPWFAPRRCPAWEWPQPRGFPNTELRAGLWEKLRPREVPGPGKNRGGRRGKQLGGDLGLPSPILTLPVRKRRLREGALRVHRDKLQSRDQDPGLVASGAGPSSPVLGGMRRLPGPSALFCAASRGMYRGKGPRSSPGHASTTPHPPPPARPPTDRLSLEGGALSVRRRNFRPTQAWV